MEEVLGIRKVIREVEEVVVEANPFGVFVVGVVELLKLNIIEGKNMLLLVLMIIEL